MSLRWISCLLVCCAACHGHDHSSYPTFQGCFDEHTMVEKLTVQQAIIVCCLDHPIDGKSEVCGASSGECVTYLTSNLDAASASTTERMAACDEYVRQKGM